MLLLLLRRLRLRRERGSRFGDGLFLTGATLTARGRVNKRLRGRVVRHGSRRFGDEVIEDGVKVS